MEKKTRKEDRRTLYTRKTIKDIFLQLLEKKTFHKITVTEVCKLAEINRGTFYLHYYDMDDVLDDILSDIMCGASGIIEHVMQPEESDRKTVNCSYPFCSRVHSNDQYRILFLDDEIAPRIIEKIADLQKESYVTWLMSHSLLTFEQAEAIFYFQMNGCLTINRISLRNHSSDWRAIQRAVDQFIRSGLEAFLIHDQRDAVLTSKN